MKRICKWGVKKAGRKMFFVADNYGDIVFQTKLQSCYGDCYLRVAENDGVQILKRNTSDDLIVFFYEKLFV